MYVWCGVVWYVWCVCGMCVEMGDEYVRIEVNVR